VGRFLGIVKTAPPPLAREYRYLASPPELRAAAPQAEGSAQKEPVPETVRGYAALFNSRSEDMGWVGNSFYEVIAPGAFDGVDYENVVALFNHDPNHPLARYGAGLSLGVDARGLWYEFALPDTTTAADIRALLKAGIISQSSFAFTVDPDGQDWEEHTEQVADKAAVTVTRTIKKINALYDVSLVTRPAYADTSVALRSLHEHRAEGGQAKLPLSARALAPEVYALCGIPLPEASPVPTL